MSHDFQKFWLKITAITVASFGPLYLLGTVPATSEPIRFAMDILSWPPDGTTTWRDPDTRFLSALTAGFLTGWGLLIWQLQARVFDIAPEPVRAAVVISALSWCIVDSIGSVTSGNAINVGFNLLILAFAVGPIARPAAHTG